MSDERTDTDTPRGLADNFPKHVEDEIVAHMENLCAISTNPLAVAHYLEGVSLGIRLSIANRFKVMGTFIWETSL